MKLIDILVEELPKSGGWLRDVKTMTQDRVGNIWGYDCVSPRLKGGLWSSKSGDDLVRDSKIEARNLAVDWNTAIITREQYEAALAAKNDGWIEWGGGLIPISTNTFVDVKFNNGDVRLGKIAGEYSWEHVWEDSNIIAYRLHQPQEAGKDKVDGETDLNECARQDAAPVWNGEGLPPVGVECESKQFAQIGWHKFRVVAVESGHVFGFWNDKVGACLDSKHWEFRPLLTEEERKREEARKAMYAAMNIIDGDIADAIYDAIAAGKIPGVKLED